MKTEFEQKRGIPLPVQGRGSEGVGPSWRARFYSKKSFIPQPTRLAITGNIVISG